MSNQSHFMKTIKRINRYFSQERVDLIVTGAILFVSTIVWVVIAATAITSLILLIFKQ